MQADVPAIVKRPLVPLKGGLKPKSAPCPIPTRPIALPADAPFGRAFNSEGKEWHVQTYVFPAASPRSLPHSTKFPNEDDGEPGPKNLNAKSPKEEIAKKLKAVTQDRLEALQNVLNEGPVDRTDASGLWITVNRYYPVAGSTKPSGENAITLVVAHANGFSKETWEPTFARLIRRGERNGEPIEEIWSLDIINQGDAAELNRETLGRHFDWSDNGRDILQFLLSYLPVKPEASESSSSTNVRGNAPSWSTEDPSLSHWSAGKANPEAQPTQHRSTNNTNPLEYQRKVGGFITEDPRLASVAKPAVPVDKPATFSPIQLKEQPLTEGLRDALLLDDSKASALNNVIAPLPKQRWRNRNIVLLGHSVGAAGMIYASSTFPQLFKKVILVDPTVYPHTVDKTKGTAGLLAGALIRRQSWKDKEEAFKLFAKNKSFYGKWDPDSLAIYVHFGLKPSPTGDGVVLRCDRMQEAYVYNDALNFGSKRAFHRLALLPSSIDTHIIRGDVDQSVIPEEIYPAFHEICKHATHARIKGSGHLVAQEKPKELADELARYLGFIPSPKPKLAKL